MFLLQLLSNDQILLDGHQSQWSKCEEICGTRGKPFCFHQLVTVLDANAKVIRLVVARLNGDHHASVQAKSGINAVANIGWKCYFLSINLPKIYVEFHAHSKSVQPHGQCHAQNHSQHAISEPV